MGQFISVDKLYQFYIASNQQICTDTRKLLKESIFFALKGSNFNANEFAQKAIDAGCALAVVDEEKYLTNAKIVLVEDVLKALQQLANFHRKKLHIPFLAITGSIVFF